MHIRIEANFNSGMVYAGASNVVLNADPMGTEEYTIKLPIPSQGSCTHSPSAWLLDWWVALHARYHLQFVDSAYPHYYGVAHSHFSL